MTFYNCWNLQMFITLHLSQGQRPAPPQPSYFTSDPYLMRQTYKLALGTLHCEYITHCTVLLFKMKYKKLFMLVLVTDPLNHSGRILFLYDIVYFWTCLSNSAVYVAIDKMLQNSASKACFQSFFHFVKKLSSLHKHAIMLVSNH